MTKAIVKYNNFQGIVTSLANPPHNSFKELVNLRTDASIGGLVPRLGIKNADYSTEITDVDTFAIREIDGIKHLLVLGNEKLTINPSYKNGELESVESNLVGTVKTFISSTGTSSIVITGLTSDEGLRLLHSIIFNATNKTYAVVTAHSYANPNTTFTINKTVASIGWATGQVIVFFKTDIQAWYDWDNYNKALTLPYTLIGTSKFISIDNNQRVALIGVKNDLWGGNLWIGRIENRKYFGSFNYDGYYCTELIPQFKGCWTPEQPHIQLSVIPSTENTSFTANVSDTFVVASPCIGWTVSPPDEDVISDNVQDYFDDAVTPNTFIRARRVAVDDPTYHLNFTVKLDAPISTERPRYDGAAAKAFVRVRVWNHQYGILWLALGDIIDGVFIERGNFKHNLPVDKEGDNHDWRWYEISVSSDKFADANNLALKVYVYNEGKYYLGDTHPMMIDLSWVYGTYPTYTDLNDLPIVNLNTNDPYAVNFSLEYDDGISESNLLYPANYGDFATDTAFKNSNLAKVGINKNKCILARIWTSYKEVINRRITALNVYGGKVVEQGTVWHYITRIPIDSGLWISNSAYPIVCEFVIGDTINTGVTYGERTGRSPFEDINKVIVHGDILQGRMFISENTDKNVVFYSSVPVYSYSSMNNFPAANFIVFNESPGDIEGIFSINGRLLVFKKFSYYSVIVEGLPSAVRVDTISSERGIASERSVVKSLRSLFFVSYDGVCETDGFKDRLIGISWQETFRALSDSAKENSFAFYDTTSDSYYLYIGSILWAYDTKTQQWRQEDFMHSIYGKPVLIDRDLSGNNVYVDDNKLFYEYPRSDKLYKDTYNSVDYNIIGNAEFNDYKESLADFSIYLNDGWILGDSFKNVILSIADKSISIATNSQDVGLFSSLVRNPLTKLQLLLNISINQYMIIKEVGFNIRVSKRVGTRSLVTQ